MQRFSSSALQHQAEVTMTVFDFMATDMRTKYLFKVSEADRISMTSQRVVCGLHADGFITSLAEVTGPR